MPTAKFRFWRSARPKALLKCRAQVRVPISKVSVPGAGPGLTVVVIIVCNYKEE